MLSARNPPSVRLISLLAILCFAVPAMQAAARDAAEREARFEELFAEAVEASDRGPALNTLDSVWSSALSAARSLERERAEVHGETPDPEAAAERMIARWEELRPESAGPEVLRALLLGDEAEKKTAIEAVARRHPGDPWAVSEAIRLLYVPGDARDTIGLAEGYVARRPEDPRGYEWLLVADLYNPGRWVPVFERWARATPGDAKLAKYWAALEMHLRHPEETRSVLGDYFAGEPGDAEDFETCEAILEKRIAGFVDAARACLERIAEAPDGDRVAAEAARLLAESAALSGESEEAAARLESLDPVARKEARIEAALQLETPERCDEVIELLSAAVDAFAEVDYHSRSGSVIAALRGCGDRAQAEAIRRRLLREAPTGSMATVVGALVATPGGVDERHLPPDAVELLEARRVSDPESAAVRQALEILYRATGAEERRFALLDDWHESDPEGFAKTTYADDLADLWVERGEPAAGVALLEDRVAERFAADDAAALWRAYRAAGDEEKAARLAAGLVASGRPDRSRLGHLLHARAALATGDRAGAEADYLHALRLGPLDAELIEELFEGLGAGDAAAQKALAGRICQAMTPGADGERLFACTAQRLMQAGHEEMVEAMLAEREAASPGDEPGAWFDLAKVAVAVGANEVAERYYGLLIAEHPEDERGWIGYGWFLLGQERYGEIAALLVRCREQLAEPPRLLVVLAESAREMGAAKE